MPKLLPKVKTLGELGRRAREDARYAELAKSAARNLGAADRDAATARAALAYLDTNAMETSEKGVVDEVNFVRDCVDVNGPSGPPPEAEFAWVRAPKRVAR